MTNIPDPIFKSKLSKISWKKIYEREYGVQYSEVAVSLFAFAKYHFPKLSVAQIVIPGSGSNTAFYIDDISWIKLVEGLNKKYTANAKKLEEYEKKFLYDGKTYLDTAKRISKIDLTKLSDKKLLSIFLDHQDKRYKYSCFAWTAFILNNYVADRAINILEPYIKKYGKETEEEKIKDALLRPEKLAAVLQLQYEVEKESGELTHKQLDNLYERFKWLSCLDIHNKPWTKQEFNQHIKSFNGLSRRKQEPFQKIIKKLKLSAKDLEYLKMVKRFVYIKDARDDFRRESIFYANNLWKELARRMDISSEEASFLQDSEVISFLKGKGGVSKQILSERKKGFIIYMDINKKLICLQGDQINKALAFFHLLSQEEKVQKILGRVASKGMAQGKAAIVRGVNDLNKVKKGSILIAVTTHPDYVSAMRRSLAIVTDEGGITSHAAIISREFGIPCIVGTKVATKVLKDGDLVEVDANNGVIKKLN